MLTMRKILALVLLPAMTAAVYAQEGVQEDSLAEAAPVVAAAEEAPSEFDVAAESVQERLEQSLAELSALREEMANETIPLNRRLSDLEAELIEVRREYQQTVRMLDSRTLDLANLGNEIKKRQEESTYLSNLLGEYARNFESRLHIAEIQRYRVQLEEAKLAPENSNLSQQEVYEAQASLISVALERLQEALGGTTFEGTAVDSSGLVQSGTFVLVGPAALFLSEDGQTVGAVEQRLGSLEPAIIAFGDPADAALAAELVSNKAGSFPLDPSLGNAHKIEQTQESLLDHIKKGGVVMYPILGLAGLALVVALAKWIHLSLVKTPSRKQINGLLTAVAKHDESGAKAQARKMKGPIGEMLAGGVDHIREPNDLIEEVMYEKVLSTRLSLERFLPFIAITAASAPLLGLLGTVTGIINTFKLITVFGSGDVKTLSGGISEALITTEFGLIVAIPSLLLHAFLSRKARGIINKMEKSAVSLVNQISKNPFGREDKDRSSAAESSWQDYAGALMNPQVVSVARNATVAEAMGKIRNAQSGREVGSIFVVDEHGKYMGYAPVDHLNQQPAQSSIESVVQTKPLFVRVNTHKNEVQNLFRIHDLPSLPVLDHEDQLVGQVTRRGNGDGK